MKTLSTRLASIGLYLARRSRGTPGPARMAQIAVATVLFVSFSLPGRSETRPRGAESGWSADLLNQILKSDAAKPTPAIAASEPSNVEMVLRTYPLAHLRVGEAGKSQNILSILGKLLPPGSSLKTDVPANSLHVLTTAAAHQAIWDYLSAVDVADIVGAPSVEVPSEVRSALQKLVEGTERSSKLADAIAALRSGVTEQLADIDRRQRRMSVRLFGGLALAAALVVLAVMVRRRPPASAAQPDVSTALALAPDQIASALVPMQDKMRTDMLGVLNEVAIKLQAQHHEQQKLVREQQRQLEDARQALADERKQFISEAGTMVVQAVERVDATTAKLARQQDKVAELVDELQHTVRELDETKDNLRDREIELEQERAKIAALSLLLEEGAPIPSTEVRNGHEGHASRPSPNFNPPNGHDAPPRVTPSSPCTNQEAITLSVKTGPTIPGPTTAPQFIFLPPDHPET